MAHGPDRDALLEEPSPIYRQELGLGEIWGIMRLHLQSAAAILSTG